jgi:hypothetical protein
LGKQQFDYFLGKLGIRNLHAPTWGGGVSRISCNQHNFIVSISHKLAYYMELILHIRSISIISIRCKLHSLGIECLLSIINKKYK